MGILIENTFSVAAPPDETYALMADVERVAPCIPGAEVTGPHEGGGFDARMAIKMGPLSLTYKGVAELVEQDPVARRAVLRARGTEQKGQGTAQALLTMAVDPAGSGSNVTVTSDILVTGRIAQMGRGIMIDVAGRMVGEMAKALEATLERDAAHRAAGEAGPPPEAVVADNPDAVGLVVKSIAGRILRRSGD